MSIHNDFEKVIHCFISTQLDDCNALCFGVSKASLSRLVQTAAARLLQGQREHVTPVLTSLHWLPLSFTIQFKMLLFANKALNGLTPPYLADLLKPFRPTRSLRSADRLLLVSPTSRLKQPGAFAVAPPG